MLIRIKYDGKARKLQEKVTSVAALRAKIGELFGPEVANLNICYKDCDDEVVNVIDDEDITNCYSEAQDLKQASITFILKKKNIASRSISSKKSSTSNSSGSEVDNEFQKIDQMVTLKTEAAPIPIVVPTQIAGGETKEEAKKKLEEAHAKKQAMMEEKKQAKLEKLEKLKLEREAKQAMKKEKNETVQKVQNKLMLRMKYFHRQAIKEDCTNPVYELGECLGDLKKDCPGLMCNVKLLGEVISDAKGEIVKALKNSLAKVLVANPALGQNLEENKAKWQEFRDSVQDKNKKDREHGFGNEDKRCRKHEDDRCHKNQEKIEKQQERERIRQEKDLQRQEKEIERALRQKVKRCRDVFPKMDKYLLRQIINQNGELEEAQLIETIKNVRKAKSSAK